MPIPPDPKRVLQWTSGNLLKRKLGKPSYWSVDDRAQSQRQANAVVWEQATGANPADLQGALYVLGDEPIRPGPQQGTRGADPYVDQVFQDGPYQMITYTDDDGVSYTENIRDFYTESAGKYLDQEGFYEERGYGYQNLGEPPSLAQISNVGTEAAPITLAPTSSIYPPRPRTVAAGYDQDRQVLTVVFRDGTFYNYYEVDRQTWSRFVTVRSKGRFIKSHLDGHPRGIANMGAVPLGHREALYRLARTAQVKSQGMNVRQGSPPKKTGKSTRPSYQRRAAARRAAAKRRYS